MRTVSLFLSSLRVLKEGDSLAITATAPDATKQCFISATYLLHNSFQWALGPESTDILKAEDISSLTRFLPTHPAARAAPRRRGQTCTFPSLEMEQISIRWWKYWIFLLFKSKVFYFANSNMTVWSRNRARHRCTGVPVQAQEHQYPSRWVPYAFEGSTLGRRIESNWILIMSTAVKIKREEWTSEGRRMLVC